MITFVAVVAVADNDVIGLDNGMVWEQRTDLRNLQKITIGKPVIMGRKSFDALGRKPLPGRPNIVLTRDANFSQGDIMVVHSPQAAIDAGAAMAAEMGVDEVSILGGAEVYELLMPWTDVIRLTEVHASPVGDVFFRVPSGDDFEEVSRRDYPAGPGDDHPFSFVELRRRPS